MATAYTSLLGLALPVTGELSGTWGDTVNNSITSLLDSAIAGTTTLSSDADVTLTTTTGASNTSRQAILLWTAGGTVTRNITAPAQSKIYTVINASSSTQSIVLRGVGPTTGVTIVKGESAVCAWNGSDFIKISNTSGAGVFTTVTASSLTSGRVTYATTAGLLTDSANLLYSGTDLTVYGLTVGRGAGAVATNTAVGASALAANTSGAQITGVGSGALQANTSGNYNSAFGANTLLANTTGSGNNAFGGSDTLIGSALSGNTTGGSNNAFGNGALVSNTTASSNSAFGHQALNKNTTASNNTAVGYRAGYSNTSGANNVAVGTDALRSNTSANYNTAVGYQAGYQNTSGTRNTFLGVFTGFEVSTGLSNTYVGYASGPNGTASTGSYNTAVGDSSLFANNTGAQNTAMGYQALTDITTGVNNTAIGFQAGFVATGSDNTLLGRSAGYTLVGGTGNTFLGYGARGSSASPVAQITIGYDVVGQGDYYVTLGSASGKIYNSFTVNATWTQTSDERLKKNIQEDTLGLSFINRLRPVKFTWKPSNELEQDNPYYAEENKRNTTTVIHGLIAQEVKAALDAEGVDTFAGWDMGPDGIQAISREMFISPLIKAIQELKAEIDSLKSQLNGA